MKRKQLGAPEMLPTNWGVRWKYDKGIFIDELHDYETGEVKHFSVNHAGRPSENIGQAQTLVGAVQLACYYLDSRELDALKARDPFEKVRACLDHTDCFEVAVYGDNDSITVECIKHNEVLHELYNASEDDEWRRNSGKEI